MIVNINLMRGKLEKSSSMKTTNTIEINGKIYDARSGALIKNAKGPTPQKKQTDSSKPTAAAKKTLAKPKANGQFIDGVKLTGKSNTATMQKAKPVAAPNSKKSVPAKPHKTAPNMKHRAQRSKTLNRKAVSAPKIEPSKETLPNSITTKVTANKRLERAMSVSKSSVVSRFPSRKTPSIDIAPTVNKVDTTTKISTTTKLPAAKTAVVTTPVTKKVKIGRKHKIKKHASFVAYILVALGFIAAALYVAYLNVPALSMKLAASQAGFSATLPSYSPQGYKVSGPVKYGPNLVTIDYGSSTEDKSFQLSQQQTNWDSNALKENYVAQQTKYEPITQQYNGLTVYLFNGKAAWVNGGKLYVLNTNGSQLAVDQILKLAASV